MLVDFRHKPTQDDITMYKYLKHYNIKTQIICTKLDKVTMKNKDTNLKLIAKTFEVDPSELILFSTITKYGRDETFKVIEDNIA